jgi:glycosyltransferase involved in cell wall biosynthesis
MTIAIDALGLDNRKAGVGNYAYYLLRALARLPFETRVDVYIQRQVSANFKDTDHIRYISCHDFKGSRDRIIYEQLSLPAMLRKGKYKVVHYLDYRTPVLPVPSRTVVTIHDLSYYLYPECFTFGSRVLKQGLTRLSLSKADRVICVSENTGRDVSAGFPAVAKDRIRIIPLGIKDMGDGDIHKFNEYMKKNGINGKYILYIGTLEPRKNIETLIVAYKRAVETFGLGHQLLLCGKPGWKYEGIYKAASESNLPGRIVFGGYAPEEILPLLYDNADMFVYPSLYEGFGLPVLEAMSRGIPVIASNTAALREAAGRAALYFEPADADTLAGLMYKMSQDSPLREKMGLEGKDRASGFSWECTAEKTLSVYRELLMEGN